MPQDRKKPIPKTKQAVNQFLHYKKKNSSSHPKKDSDDNDNSQYDVEIVSTAYPKKGNVISVVQQDKPSENVVLCLKNHMSDSVILDSLTRNKKNIAINSIKIQPGKSECLTILNIDFHGLDLVHTYIDFCFHIEKSDIKFPKSIVISAQVKTKAHELIKPTSPYKRLPGALIQKGQNSKNVYPAPSLQKIPLNNLPKAKLSEYEIPEDIRKIINHGLKDDGHLPEQDVLKSKEIKNILGSKLTKNNYKEYFKLLLYIEEMQNEIEIGKFLIEKTTMYSLETIQEGIYLELEISSLIDSNINIHKSDKVSVRIINNDKTLSNDTYLGNIAAVKTSSITIIFGKKLASLYHDDMQFEVHFRPSRYCVRVQHRALELVTKRNLWPVLFPESQDVGQFGKNPQVIEKFFDKDIKKNPEQKAAVSNIVSGCSRPCPYIIFGPPGTGKTVTIVEAMKQIVSLFPESHILACAVSNAAADILALKLLQHDSKPKLLRMYAMSYDPNKIPLEIYLSSNFSEKEDSYFYPSIDELMTNRIVVCTAMTASRLTAPEILGCFTHIFIDEAGFCKESELNVAFAGTLELSKTQLVLAGDPKQLGPMIRSPFAAEYKLDVPLIERIMTNSPIYRRQSDGKFNNQVITKLLKNYRTHPDILKIVNELFYDKELQAAADKKIVSQFCDWTNLPKAGFPLILHSVVGQEEREGNSSSYFNVEEASIVASYISLLCREGFKTRDIGVITPYCKQVQKINILLQREKIKNVKVNSVEKFLGDERLIIIISTVRSNPLDAKNNYQNCMLGFINNQKRFNVAISRTKALLVVIGNVHSLCSDPNWHWLIRYCTDNGAIKAESVSAKDNVIKFVNDYQLN